MTPDEYAEYQRVLTLEEEIQDILPELCDLLEWDCYGNSSDNGPMVRGECERTNTVRSWGVGRHDRGGLRLAMHVLARIQQIGKPGEWTHYTPSVFSDSVTVWGPTDPYDVNGHETVRVIAGRSPADIAHAIIMSCLEALRRGKGKA